MEEDEYMKELSKIPRAEQVPVQSRSGDNDHKPMLKKLFENYMDPVTKKVRKDLVPNLAKDYENITGHQINDLLEALPAFYPDAEEYSLEQLYDTFCNPCFGKEFSDVTPVAFKADQPMLKLIKAVPPAELEQHSSAVLQQKFQRHLQPIEDIVQSYGKEALSKDALADMLDKICVVSKFAIADVTQATENNGQISSNSRLVAEQVFEAEGIVLLSTVGLSARAVEAKIEGFMAASPGFIAIDLDNELGLYAAHQECKKEEEDEFLTQLKNTIAKYEAVLKEQSAKGLDTAATERLIQSLKEQLDEYIASSKKKGADSFSKTSTNRKVVKKPKKPMTKEEIRSEALKEIFLFYNKQRALSCIRQTFDAAGEESTQMPMGYFMKVIKDFNIEIASQKVKELFIKTSVGGRFLLLSNFKELLVKVAGEWNKEKAAEMEREKGLVVFRLGRNKRKLEEQQGSEAVSGKLRTKCAQLEKELEELNSRIAVCRGKSADDVVEELYNYMGIYELNKGYRQSLKGIDNKPLGVKMETRTSEKLKEMTDKLRESFKSITRKKKETDTSKLTITNSKSPVVSSRKKTSSNNMFERYQDSSRSKKWETKPPAVKFNSLSLASHPMQSIVSQSEDDEYLNMLSMLEQRRADMTIGQTSEPEIKVEPPEDYFSTLEVSRPYLVASPKPVAANTHKRANMIEKVRDKEEQDRMGGIMKLQNQKMQKALRVLRKNEIHQFHNDIIN